MSLRILRQIHFYLGCIFAPLILYFSLSGAWQVFRLNDLPKNQPASAIQTLLHEISKPHTNSTLPGANPRESSSTAFKVLAVGLGLGLTLTSALGVVLAFKYGRSRRVVFLCLSLGVVIPFLFLLLR